MPSDTKQQAKINMTLRITQEMYDAVREVSIAYGLSMQSIIVSGIQDRLDFEREEKIGRRE